MAQCDSNSLVAAAACLEQQIPIGMQQPVIIYLLCQIAGIAPDPNALMAAASCLNCGLPDGIQRFIMVQLLCQIAAGPATLPTVTISLFAGDTIKISPLSITPASWLVQNSSDGVTGWTTVSTQPGGTFIFSGGASGQYSRVLGVDGSNHPVTQYSNVLLLP